MDKLRGLPLKEMYDAIEQQMSLTDRQQMVFTLYYRRGFTLQEIADNNELDIQAVQRELKSIKRKFLFVNTKKIPHWEEVTSI